jgi:HD-GYP domain-containing protein (c-di-GMP phosphodiesterase class II)
LIKKITVKQLKVGMYITDAYNQWIPSGATSRKGKIKNQETIDKIIHLGVEILYIDTEKGIDCPEVEEFNPTIESQLRLQQTSEQVMQSGVAAPNKVSLKEERGRAEKLHSQAKEMIGGVLEDVKNGKGIDAQVITNMAEELSASLDRNSNALSCLSRIREKDAYLLEHSVNVGIMLGIFAKSLKMERAIISELVTGGILHDIGKILVPDEVLNKPGKLEADEWEEMKRHVTYGERVLDQTEGLSDLVRSICRLHHERLDGSGYPRNLKSEEISLYGRMSSIVDVYDAITADRVYHQGMAPNDALKKLIEWSVFHLDKELVYAFIRCVSVYPVGTVLELSNGRAGVVIQSNPTQPKRPLLRVFYNVRHQHYIEPYTLDLASGRIEDTVVRTIDTREWGINEMDFV